MVQILSASHKPVYSTQQFLSAELETLMRSLPKNWDTKTKYRYATRTLKALLRTKVNPKSAVQKILLPTANHVAQTYSRPESWGTQTSVPNVTSTSKDNPQNQTQWPDMASCVKAGVDSGASLSQSRTNCLQYFPPGPSQMGGIEKRTGSGGRGGMSSKITTYYPGPQGFDKKNPQVLENKTKSASIDGVPYHLYTYADSSDIERLKNVSSPIRSAATQERVDDVLHTFSAEYALSRIPEQRQQKHDSRIRQAKLEEPDKPAWAILFENRFS